MNGQKIMCAACGTSNWTDFERCRSCNQKLDIKIGKEDETKRQRETSISYRLNKRFNRLLRAS